MHICSATWCWSYLLQTADELLHADAVLWKPDEHSIIPEAQSSQDIEQNVSWNMLPPYHFVYAFSGIAVDYEYLLPQKSWWDALKVFTSDCLIAEKLGFSLISGKKVWNKLVCLLSLAIVLMCFYWSQGM